MICQVCEAELDDGATVCEACGTVAGAADGQTLISFGYSRDTVGGPPRGNVLAERYEVVSRLSTDVMASRYKALDQETDNSVLVTVLSPELFNSNRERDDYLARLEPEIGRGGAYLPGLMDADRDGHFVFVVEPFVPGPTLREILDARRSRGEAMEPAEVLPVAAQLHAALASVNGTLPHGDVRAERVIVSKEGVRLTGAFILAALPKQVFADAVTRNSGWRALLAPEVVRVGTSTASDRYGAAAIIVEALTRKPPSGVLPVLNGSLASIGDEVRGLLALDPNERSASLAPLLECIARAAHVATPRFDPSSFKRPRIAKAPRPMPTGRRDSSPLIHKNKFDDEITEERPASLASPASAPKATPSKFPLHDPATVPEPARFDSDRPKNDGTDTQRYPVLRESQPPASSPPAPLRRTDSIPSSVGSAINKHMRQNGPQAIVPPPPRGPSSHAPATEDDIDPRLMRAALGITLDDATLEHDEVPHASLATMDTVQDYVNGDETQPVPIMDEDVRESPRPRPLTTPTPIPPRLRKSAMPQTAAERSMTPGPLRSPPPMRMGSVPPPPPPRIPNAAMQAYPSVAFHEGPPPTGAITTRGAEPTDLVRHPGSDFDRVTVPPDPNAMTMKPHASRSGTGVWIIGAIFLGVIIVASAILYRKHRDKEIHEQLLHQRFQNTLESETR
ncbi:MAG: hypothetical protein IPK60_16075 [Sandaracinaceae bacterium]|nr:hypothetical protein [Sandaracinaceae bacterium]